MSSQVNGKELSMSNYAKAKGTEIEKSIQGQMQAELSGAGMYFSLARLAKEHKLDDAGEKFRHTRFEQIEAAKEFTVSIPLERTPDIAKAMGFCGYRNGKNIDKFKECNLKAL